MRSTNGHLLIYLLHVVTCNLQVVSFNFRRGVVVEVLASLLLRKSYGLWTIFARVSAGSSGATAEFVVIQSSVRLFTVTAFRFSARK